MDKKDLAIKRHVLVQKWMQDLLFDQDEMAKPIMGIADFDDAVCLQFDGVLVASTDGPYDKRLVMKSALIHAATDVVVKGALPLFSLDNLVGNESDLKEMLSSLAHQARKMNIPLLGGNTKIEDVNPTACVTVIGKLLIAEPIRDGTAKEGDAIAILGDPIWGAQAERIEKAKRLFAAWFASLDKVIINSSKDVTKGGLAAAVYEMQEKSGRIFNICDHSFHKTRNLDNFIVTLAEDELEKMSEIFKGYGCPIVRIGTVD